MQINQNYSDTTFGSTSYARSFKKLSPRVRNEFAIKDKTIKTLSEGLHFRFSNGGKPMGISSINLLISEERTFWEKLFGIKGFKKPYNLIATKNFCSEKLVNLAKNNFLEELEVFNKKTMQKNLGRKSLKDQKKRA